MLAIPQTAQMVVVLLAHQEPVAVAALHQKQQVAQTLAVLAGQVFVSSAIPQLSHPLYPQLAIRR
jgi:hypothetical protein